MRQINSHSSIFAAFYPLSPLRGQLPRKGGSQEILRQQKSLPSPITGTKGKPSAVPPAFVHIVRTQSPITAGRRPALAGRSRANQAGQTSKAAFSRRPPLSGERCCYFPVQHICTKLFIAQTTWIGKEKMQKWGAPSHLALPPGELAPPQAVTERALSGLASLGHLPQWGGKSHSTKKFSNFLTSSPSRAIVSYTSNEPIN